MWEVVNRTPFGALGYFVRDRNGAEHWTLAVTALFDVRPDGLLAIAADQPSPLLAPTYRDAACRELRAASDLAPFKPNPDIVVQGTACLPDEAAGVRFEVEIVVGSLAKSAHVFGERTLRRTRTGLTLEPSSEVLGVLLSWKNVLGGPDLHDAEAAAHPHNPVGMGWTSAWTDLPDGSELALPHIENPAAPIMAGQPLPLPHGFGPVQPAWRPRLDHAGTYDEAWRQTRSPRLPEDFSEAFHQVAPADQVYPGPLEGAVPVRITGCHPDGPYAYRLPQIVLDARTQLGSEQIPSRFRLIQATLGASARTVRLTWNTHVPCNGRDHLVRRSVVTLRQMAGVAG